MCPCPNIMNKTGIIITIFTESHWGYNAPESYGQPPYQHPGSYTPPEQPLEEPIDWEKKMEALEELERRI